MTDSYFIAKKAKKSIQVIDHLGWPDTETDIRRLIAELTDAQITVCLEGRFIRKFDGWHFRFPATDQVIKVLEGRVQPKRELTFAEDLDG